MLEETFGDEQTHLEPRRRRIVIGKIAGAHGVNGTLKVVSYAESADFFQPGASLFVSIDTDVLQEFTVIDADPPDRRGRLRLRFRGVEDRTTANSLRGADLLANRADFPGPEEDTYYWADLIGLDVFTETGECLGQVVRILETGANDVFVVSSAVEEILIPAIAPVVLSVDVLQGRMTVRLPEGLRDPR